MAHGTVAHTHGDRAVLSNVPLGRHGIRAALNVALRKYVPHSDLASIGHSMGTEKTIGGPSLNFFNFGPGLSRNKVGKATKARREFLLIDELSGKETLDDED